MVLKRNRNTPRLVWAACGVEESVDSEGPVSLVEVPRYVLPTARLRGELFAADWWEQGR